jgi:hypothetical protein
MGGMISLGIRRSPDSFETVTAWTNPLPRIVKSRAFLEGDFREFDEYVGFYREDRNNQGYGPSRHVPSEYGYVLFDFVERRMASAGHYTTIDRIGRTEIEYDRHRRLTEIEALVGRITHRIESDGDVEAGPFTIEDFPSIATFDWEQHPAELYANFRFRFPDWRVVASGSSPDTFKIVFSEVASLADLSAEDRDEWKRCWTDDLDD